MTLRFLASFHTRPSASFDSGGKQVPREGKMLTRGHSIGLGEWDWGPRLLTVFPLPSYTPQVSSLNFPKIKEGPSVLDSFFEGQRKMTFSHLWPWSQGFKKNKHILSTYHVVARCDGCSQVVQSLNARVPGDEKLLKLRGGMELIWPGRNNFLWALESGRDLFSPQRKSSRIGNL